MSTNFFVPLFKSFLIGLPKRVVTVLATFFLVINQVIIPVPNSLLPTLSPAIAHASEDNGTTVSIEASGDAYLSKQYPDQNYGITDLITVDGQDINGDPNTELRGLIKWNLDQLPEGSVVQSARMILHLVNHSGGNVYTLHKSTKDWNETDVTWNNASADFESASLGMLSSNILGLHSIPLNSDGIAAIQSWIDNPETNFGFLILPDANSTNGFEFKSKDSSIKPVLEVTAAFPQDASYNVEMSVSGDGAIFVSPEQPFGFNDNVTFTAEAGDGWEFDQWQGDLSGTENPKTISIQSNMHVTAAFRSTASSDPQMGISSCGNGALDYGEQCEGSNLGGQSCASLGGSGSSGNLSCNSDCTFNMGGCSFAWPAEAFGSAENLSSIDNTNGFEVNLSGAVWNPVSRKLWVVRNGGTGGSKFWVLKENGSGGFEVDYKNGNRGEWTNFGDLEAIALADFNDPDVVYLLIEGEERIKRYNVSTYGTAILERNWNTSPHLPLNGGSGAEALAFIPDSFLTAQGFVDSNGNPRVSQNGMGGLMFVGHQNGGRIYVFDLNPNNDNFTFVGAYRTNYGETADLEFDHSTGYLYVFHGANHNHTEVISLASTISGGERKFVTLVDYNRPTGSATNSNMEGIALLPIDDCVNSVRDFFLTIDDGGADSLFRFRNFPCGLARNKVPIVNAGSDTIITLPASATLNGSASDDRLPSGTLDIAWTQTGFVPAPGVSGTGTASFSESANETTTVSFDKAGDYTLRLTASDSEMAAADDVVVTVNAEAASTFTITANAGSNGSISPSGSVNANYGEDKVFTVSPATGYHIEDVLVDGNSVGAVSSYTFSNVTDNHTIAASFAINAFTIDASAGANGSISPSGDVSVNSGDDQTFTIAANNNFEIQDVLIDGVSVGAVSSYTFSNVTGNHSIAASFASVDTMKDTQLRQQDPNINFGNAGTLNVDGDEPGGSGKDVYALLKFNLSNIPAGNIVDSASIQLNITNPTSQDYPIYAMTRDWSENQSNWNQATAGTNWQGAGASADHSGIVLGIARPTATGNYAINLNTDGVATVQGWINNPASNFGFFIGSTTSTDGFDFTSFESATPPVLNVASRSGYTMTAAVNGNGTVAKNPDQPYYNSGSTMSLTATAGSDSTFTGWSGDASGSQNPLTITMDGDKNVTANFAIRTYALTATAGANGNISPAGVTTVNHGANQAYTMTPAAGYHIQDIKLDGVSVGSTSPYTLTNITADHTISVTFAINSYTISASADSRGSISPSGDVSINHGESQNFTITPNAGYDISDVLVDGASAGAVSSYTFLNVTDNHTIAASFAINAFTIDASAGANGSIDPSGSVNANYGEDKVFTVSPATGYHIEDVLVDGASVGAVSSYTFSNVTDNHTIAASFAVDTFALTATASGNGSISANPDSASYPYGTEVTLSATASQGSEFAGWSGDASGSENPITITMDGNKTISADFSQMEYGVTITSPENGTITMDPEGPYHLNDVVTVTAAPNEHYQFANWNGDLSGSENPASLTVTGNMSVGASFSAVVYTIQANAGSNGSISPSGSVNVSAGEDQVFTITPNTGYHIEDVLVDGSSVGAVASYSFGNVTANHTIAASFAVDTFALSASVSGNGSISKSPDQPYYNNGSSVTLTATAGADSIFTGWSGDASGTANPLSVTMNGDKNITANFAVRTYSLTASVEGSGSISPSGVTSVSHGGSQTYTITPAAGYRTQFVKVDGVSVGSVESYTFNNVTANHMIAATFSVNTFIVSASNGSNGNISPVGNTPVNEGAEQAYVITPDSGYAIEDVLVDNQSMGAISSYTFRNVDGNHTISASFTMIRRELTITTNRGLGGAVIINPDSPDGTYPHGMEVTLTAIANPGNIFSGWSGDVGGLINPVTVTMDADKNIMANFNMITYSVEVETTTGGAVEVSPEGPYYLGDEITLTATPDSNHTFNGWSGDVSGSDNPLSVTVTGNMNITANFSPITYTLNVATVGSGTVTKNPNLTEYPAGTPVTLTAQPARFWSFLRWNGNASGTNPVVTIVMDGNKNVTARFKRSLNSFQGAIGP